MNHKSSIKPIPPESDQKKLEELVEQLQEALHDSEKKYRSLIENISVGIFRSTPEPGGKFIDVNPALVEMLGYGAKHELYAKQVSEIYLNPEDRRIFSDKLSRLGSLHCEKLQLIKKDGTPIIVSESAVVTRHENGAIIYFDGIIEDITEQEKIEQELILQKTYLEELFNSAPEAIVLHDKNDIVLDINSEFTRLFGYTKDEAVGKPINQLVVPEAFLDEGAELSANVINGLRVEKDSRRQQKDGSLVDVSILGAPIFHDGKQMGVYAIYRDISERKKAEDDLLIQKTYLEKLFNSAPEAIVLHDNDDLIANVNEEFTKVFGYTKDEVIGKPINEILASETYLDEATEISDKVIRGERIDLISKRKRKDGSLIDVSILGSPIIHHGKQIGDYAIYRDITESKKAQEAKIRLDEEARMARHIQLQLLPDKNPEISGYNIAGKSIPALNVGGDYYDFIRLDEHRVAIGLGDVSGKGLGAALIMANLQATIRSQALFGIGPDKCLENANNLLFHSTDSRTFVSLFYGILDTSANTLEYANAGQDIPIHTKKNAEPNFLRHHGVALGMTEHSTYQTNRVTLQAGEVILVYTDGIREAMNSAQVEFGEQAIAEIARENYLQDGENIIAELFHSVDTHTKGAPQQDDMTVIIIKRE